MNERLIALNRFGLGATTGRVDAADDPRGWLLAQLSRPPETVVDWTTRGVELPTLDEAGEAFTALRQAQRDRDQGATTAPRSALNDMRTREVTALLDRRLRADSPYVERLVAFWSNHLCVSTAAKIQVAATAGHYERTVIRPHVLGRFEDMVLASARHPAMLFYLDNFQSVGPDSRVGRRSSRGQNPRGLNENYARELLELHTLGVNGGYDQKDVEALARILTGWTVGGVGPLARDQGSVGFAFRNEIHQPGEKSVLGRRYREEGVEEGEAAIRDLCRHPSTARFIATKLIRHFVSDDPPDGAVTQIERTFLDSEGDLGEVAAALVSVEDAWHPDHRKFRSPQDWLIAAFRAVGAENAPPALGRLLRQLRHTPWAPGSPKGYGDTRGEWADPDALMNRAELARSLAREAFRGGPGRGRRDPATILDVVAIDAEDPLFTFATDAAIPEEERFALVVGGPAFQWR